MSLNDYFRCLVTLLIVTTASQTTLAESPLRFRVRLDQSLTEKPVSGRLFVYLSTSSRRAPKRGIEWFTPEPLFGVDVRDFAPSESRDVAANAAGFPDSLSELPPGKYYVHSLLQISRYDGDPGRATGNFYSTPVELDLNPAKSGIVELELKNRIPPPSPYSKVWMDEIAVPCPTLSKFFGRDFIEQATVVLPPSYGKHPDRRYPVLYSVPSFNETHRTSWSRLVGSREATVDEVEFILVMLNGQSPWGHHVYANSATNGPRADSLVNDLIPYIDQHYQTVAAPTARFLTGHSSGGWSSLWLQINYPDTFGGVWASAPDPVDFHDFMGIDIYSDPPQSMYVDPDGNRRQLSRPYRGNVLWGDSFCRLDDTYARGGQMRAFEAVFSPLDEQGEPRKLWSRTDGRMDPVTAQAWKQYDIRHILEENWDRLESRLAGKIHIVVGSEDTLLLEGAVERLKESLERLGSDANIKIIPGGTHFTTLTEDRRRQMRTGIATTFLAHHADDYGDVPNVERAVDNAAFARIAASDGVSLDLSPPDESPARSQKPFLVDDRLLQRVAQMTGLQKLNLRQAKISAHGAEALLSLRDLRELDLSYTGLGDEALTTIGKLEQLEKLVFYRNNIGRSGAKAISNLRNLKHLDLGYCGVDSETLAALGKMPNLTLLKLGTADVLDTDMESISKMKSLEQVELSSGNITIKGAAHLSSLPKIKRISLSRCTLTPNEQEELRRAVGETVDEKIEWEFRSSPFVVDTADPSRPVYRVNLNSIRFDSDDAVSRLSVLDAFDDLRELNLSRASLSEVAEQSLSRIRSFKSSIQMLDLSYVTFSQRDSDLLAAFPNLQKLYLRSADVGDRLSGLGQRNRLDTLYLSSSPITDAEFSGIRGHENVQRMSLNGCKGVTDQSVPVLQSLIGLRWLDVQGTLITQAGIERLKRALPACVVLSGRRQWEWRYSGADAPVVIASTDSDAEKPIYTRRRVLFDASKARNLWWAAQTRDPFNPRSPHQIQLGPEYLRQLGFEVNVLEPGTSVTPKVLAENDIVIRVRSEEPYEIEEVKAYQNAVRQGLRLVLLGRPANRDALARQFQIGFGSQQQVGRIYSYRKNPMTAHLADRYGPFYSVESSGNDLIGLGWAGPEDTLLVLGLMRHGEGIIVAAGGDLADDRDPRSLADIVKSLAAADQARFARLGDDPVIVTPFRSAPRSPELQEPDDETILPDRSRQQWDFRWKAVPDIRTAQLIVYGPARDQWIDQTVTAKRGEIRVRASAAFKIAEQQRDDWRWQMRFRDFGGDWGRWSSARSFRIAASAKSESKPFAPIQPITGSHIIAESPIIQPRFSGNGRWLMQAPWGGKGVGKVWDVSQDQPRVVIDQLTSSGLRNRPFFSGDARWVGTLVGGSSSQQGKLLSLEPEQRKDILFYHPPSVISTRLAGNARWYISRTRESNRLWDLDSDHPTKSFFVVNEPQSMRAMDPFMTGPNGRWLLAGNRLLDLSSSSPVESSRGIETATLSPARFSPDAKWLILGKQLISLDDSKVEMTTYSLPGDIKADVTFSHDRKSVLIGSDLIDLSADAPSSAVIRLPVDDRCVKFQFSADDKLLVAAGSNLIQVWDLSSQEPGQTTRECAGPGGGYISFPLSYHLALTFSEDNRWLVATTYDGDALLIDLAESKLSVKRLTNDGRDYRVIGFSKNGRWLHVGEGTKLRLWDLSRDDVGNPESSTSLFDGRGRGMGLTQRSGDGRWIAAVPGYGPPQLWDWTADDPAETGVLIDHPQSNGQFSPDGRLFLTRSQPAFGAAAVPNEQADIRLWQLSAETIADSAIQIPGHFGRVHSAIFSPDGRWLLISDDRSTRLWDVHSLLNP